MYFSPLPNLVHASSTECIWVNCTVTYNIIFWTKSLFRSRKKISGQEWGILCYHLCVITWSKVYFLSPLTLVCGYWLLVDNRYAMTFNPVSRSKVRVTIDLWENLNPAQVFSALMTFIHRVCVCVLVVKKYKINLNQVSRWKEYMYICVCDCMLLVQNIFFLKQGCWLSKIWHFSIACHFLNYRRIKLLGSIWFYMTKCWQLENTC